MKAVGRLQKWTKICRSTVKLMPKNIECWSRKPKMGGSILLLRATFSVWAFWSYDVLYFITQILFDFFKGMNEGWLLISKLLHTHYLPIYWLQRTCFVYAKKDPSTYKLATAVLSISKNKGYADLECLSTAQLKLAS